MRNWIGWVVAIGILAAVGFYSYSCVRVSSQDASFHQNLDELRRVIQNHNVRSVLVTPSLLVDEIIELAERAGVELDEDAVEITAEQVEIARDDDDGCVVTGWPDTAMNLSPLDQDKLSLGISHACPTIPRWVIGVRAQASISYGLVSRELSYERYLVVVRYAAADELE